MKTSNCMRKKPAKFSCVVGASNTTVIMESARLIRCHTAILAGTIADIRAGQSQRKTNLPAVCWAATFKDGKRHAESAEPTGLAYIDIDHVHENLVRLNRLPKDMMTPGDYASGKYASELYEQLFQGYEEELGIVHAQISPSGDGLHIVFFPRLWPLEEAQKAFAEDSGLQFWDKQCKDISRLLFLSSVSDTLYDALDTIVDE